MTREPYALVVSRPASMSEEGFQWASESTRRHADMLGLDVTVATDDRSGRAFRRLVKAWPFGGHR